MHDDRHARPLVAVGEAHLQVATLGDDWLLPVLQVTHVEQVLLEEEKGSEDIFIYLISFPWCAS